MQKSEKVNGKSLIKELKKMEKAVANDKELQENRLFERELRELIRTASGQFFSVCGGIPVLGREVAALEDINDDTVSELLSKQLLDGYIGEDDINSLLWQSKLCVIRNALTDDKNPDKYMKLMYSLKDLDTEKIQNLSPVHSAFSFDEIYNGSSPETRAAYRRKTALIARSAGFDEERYTRELVKRAVIDDLHIGEVIETDYRNVFPYAGVKRYLMWLFLFTAVITAGLGLLTRLWIIPVAFLPVFAFIKPLADIIASRFVPGGQLPRMDIKDTLPDNGRTLCTMSALIGDESSLRDALLRLRNAKLKNPQKGIFFALLCDMAAGEKEVSEADGSLFAKAERLREELFPESILIFRRRTYSKTMRQWQGFDRKRGAVEELARFMCGEDIEFAFVSGNEVQRIRDCEFIAALDLDTIPLMDSIRDLAAVALHPLNNKYGIIAPRCTSTLDSTLKSPFSRAMAGNGGVCGISAYDNISGEFYFDCFGEGIFCGKGLIRKKDFLKACKGKFPPERVLSHDILEGGLTGVAYAGDIEFSDSFPASSKAYFKRAHRWIRGDFQNLRFIFRRDFSLLTRFKLFDNFRRGINPILIFALFFISCFIRNGFFAAITAYLALLVPFLPSISGAVSRGFAFGITRRFYSPIVSETAQLALKALMEIVTLPKSALISLDAGIKTLWRNLVSKRKLLEWTTSGFLEKTAFKGGIWHLLPSFAASLGLLICCIYGKFYAAPAALIMCSALPVLAYADRPAGKRRTGLNAAAQKELLEQTEKMWKFYTSYVNEGVNYLPPDNVQFHPVFRICMRTSPTNIGMYLLSAAAVFELRLISGENFVKIVENSVESVEKLHKWRGNLFNWYDIKTLEPVSGFVSSVDSGNFIACLIAVKECLRIHGLAEELVRRCNSIIDETRLSEFYCERRKLFSIGYDTEKEKLSPHRYDMLMSEARLMSYVAVAKGDAPKSHWRALSRTMSRSGRYAGAIAWTGTMFEFYMPELLLTSKEGSMSYEALRYAFHCQKHSHCPFGISESGYYAFDRELNYQYKAHGVQKTALKAGMNKECVVSPYSSYLTLSAYPLESWNNLARLEKEGAFNDDFGFYEAVDYTRERVGSSSRAVIKSHMAHHVGMSIAGAANALKDNICSGLFMGDEKMKRAEELLEEKVMSGEKVLKITDYHYDDGKSSCEREEITRHNVFGSPVNTLCGGELSLFTSANGLFCGNFKGLQTVNKTRDYGERPSGAFYGLCSEKNLYPFFYHPVIDASSKHLNTVFEGNATEYMIDDKEFRLAMQVKAEGRYNAELRRFTLKNKTRSRKQLTLCAYSEPTLTAERDYTAHPVFMDLFLKIEYDKESKLFIFYRKERHGNKITACAAGFIEETDFSYCLSKENCGGPTPFYFFKKALIRECIDRSVPDPCLFIKSDITLDPGAENKLTLFYCYGDSVDAVKRAAAELRAGGAGNAEDGCSPSPLSLNTLHGRIAAKALPALLYGDVTDEAILNARKDNKLNRRALWRYGISGDHPLIVAEWGEGISSLILMKQGLVRCGVNADLIVFCSNALEKKQADEALGDNGYALVKNEAGDEIITLIYSLAAAVAGNLKNGNHIGKNNEVKQKPALPVISCSHKDEENGFSESGFTIGKEENTWCNVLANPDFGTLLSQNSLGFTWALNSRENKLTPWSNDIIRDNFGETLLLKCGAVYYDLIRGSKAEFSPYSCSYSGTVPGAESRVDVKVYTKGTGKEISLTLTNTSDAEQSYDLVYRIIPVMGGEREAAMPVAFSDSGSLVVENSQNPYFKGKTVLYCSKKVTYCFSPQDIAAGDFSRAEEEAQRRYCSMAAAIVPLKLPPRENLRIRFILGYFNDADTPETSGEEAASRAVEYVKSLEGGPCGNEFENRIQIACPDGKLNSMFNIWLPHQTTACRLWARTGFFQNGGAFGFRDQLQDCLAAMYFSPETAYEHILRCCQSQFPEGDVLHWWHELNGKRTGVRTRYSDDLLWLPYTACEYGEAFGDENYWQTLSEYCTGDLLPDGKQELFMEAEGSGVKESLYQHCKKAMEKGFSKGRHGLVKIGCGDWNDGYNNVGVNGEGESVWLSMFYVMCGKKFAAVAREQSEGDYAQKLEKRIAELCIAIEENCWDKDQYIRAFYDNGEKMGSSENGACSIDLLPQAFSVLSGLPDTQRCITALDSAWERLVDRKNGIIKLFTPAFTEENTDQRPGYVMSYPRGIRENGGQYTHAAVWYCLACFKAGQRERAMALLGMLNPAYKGDDFGREPYFMTADIYTNPQCYGRGGWSMYTGAAAWYWRCIFEGLFGASVHKGELVLKPNLPPEFSGASLMFNEVSIRFVYTEGAAAAESKIKLDGSVKETEVYYS